MSKRILLIFTTFICLSGVGMALYMQIEKGMLPCPSCILQRYAFMGVAIFAFFGAVFNVSRFFALPALGCAIAGAWVAASQLHSLSTLALSCGFDPLSVKLNALFAAQVFPQMFQAVGLCTTPYPPFLGLSFPMWALLLFAGLAILLFWVALSPSKKPRPF